MLKSQMVRSAVGNAMRATKNADYEHYLAGLIWPDTHRNAFFALRAFNIELAKIKSVVSSPEVGRGRFAWWDVALDDAAEGGAFVASGRECEEGRNGETGLLGGSVGARDPVVIALANTVFAGEDAGGVGGTGRAGLVKRWLKGVVDARRNDLDTDQVSTMDEIEEYGEATGSGLNYAALALLGVQDVGADHIASHLGKAWAITSLLRGMPHHLAKKQLYIPLEFTIKHSLVSHTLFDSEEGTQAPEFRDAVLDMAAVAKAHVDHAAELWDQGREGGLPKETKYVIPGLWFMQAYLEALEKADFDPTVVGGDATRSAGALWKLAKLAL